MSFNLETKFTVSEHVMLNAIKSQLEAMIHTKQIFWNGVMSDCVIAGGVFSSLINNEAIKDIDVFILNKNVSVYAHLTDNARINDVWQIRDVGAGTYLDNPHIHGTALNTNTKVQYILTDYKSRKELLDDFDYRHTTMSYVPIEQKLYSTYSAYRCIVNKHLIINSKRKPHHWRPVKFKGRGWKEVNEAPVINTVDLSPFKDSYQKTVDKVITDWIDDMMNRHRHEVAADQQTK